MPCSWTFGIFPWLCTAVHMKKCITIHVLLGNIRPRFRYRKMQILWTFTLQGAGGRVAPHPPKCIAQWPTVIACSVYNIIRVPDQEIKKHYWARKGRGGAIIRGALPAASLPPRHCIRIQNSASLDLQTSNFRQVLQSSAGIFTTTSESFLKIQHAVRLG